MLVKCISAMCSVAERSKLMTNKDMENVVEEEERRRK